MAEEGQEIWEIPEHLGEVQPGDILVAARNLETDPNAKPRWTVGRVSASALQARIAALEARIAVLEGS